MFRAKFAEAMKGSWEVDKKVENHVKTMVTDLINANRKTAIEKIGQEILSAGIKA
jgi:hypothetical protein